LGYLWSAASVPLTVTVDGAYMVLTPAAPLQHGVTYTVQHVDASGNAVSGGLMDELGNAIYDSGTGFTVDTTLLAKPGLTGQVAMLTGATPVTLNSASSVSTYGITAYQWTQVDGPALSFGSPNQASTTVALASGVSERGTATVELKVTDAQGQVEYNRLAVLIDPDPSGTTYVYYRSEQGDYIGQGKTVLGRADTATAAAAYSSNNYLRVNIPSLGGSGDWWTLNLAGADGQFIHVGTYSDALRAPFHGTNNGLDFSGSGRGCNTLTGNFDVREVAYDAAGNVSRLAVDFVQHCEGGATALYGSLRYHSAIPLKP
jgi:hypothetical protein